MKKYIPNTLTLLNLFCGCCAIVAILSAEAVYVLLFAGVGVVFDFFDGAVARWLEVPSTIGKELDSLADLVTFGVLPGAVIYTLLGQNSLELSPPGFRPFLLPAFLVSVFACLRLARFNLDTRQEENFLGLPTPSATMFILGLLWIYHAQSPFWSELVLMPTVLWATVLIISGLMVSEIPMFSLKIKSTSWKGNELKVVFVVLIILMVVILKAASLSAIILLYILINIFLYLIKGLQRS